MPEYYTILNSNDSDDLALDTKEEESLTLPFLARESATARKVPAESSVFGWKAGVAVLVLVNLLVWAFALTRLRYVAGVLKESLETTDTRLLPRPDPLDGLMEFLAAKQGSAASGY